MSRCPSCGAAVLNAPFCQSCGTHLGARTGVDFAPAPIVTPVTPVGSGHAPPQARPRWVLPTVLISLALSAAGGYVLLQPPAPTPASAAGAAGAPTPAPSKSTPEAEPPVTTVTETVPADPEPREESKQAAPRLVTNLPAGLKCADLKKRGYSYASAFEYWQHWDIPDIMDEDLNGTPCESVYSDREIELFFVGADGEILIEDEPGGLECRHLKGRGYSYDDAIAYWRMHGQPTRMDEDGDDVPCEAVYPEATVDYFLHNP